ncbi:MAG: DUF4395 domain-containing protein [Acidimicrobiia bacterium]
MTTRVDVNVPRFNQACVAALTALAFVVQWWPLVAVTALILAATRFAGPRYGPFTQAYVRFIKPRRNSDVETEEAAPPRFAQLLGTIFLGVASVAFLLGWMAFGWVLTLTVTALATLAAATRICVGCIVYKQAVSH